MAKLVKVEGVRAILTNLKGASLKLSKQFEIGLKQAGLHLQRESQKVVPVEFGDLRRSAETRSEGHGLSTTVLVTYTQSYAIYVHENLEAKHAPGKIAKFLEKPARDNTKQMLEIIARATKI